MNCLNAQEFNENVFNLELGENTYTKETPAIIDCFTTWCAPCKVLSPIFEEISLEYSNINFYKVNLEELPEVAKHFNIKNVPTIIFLNKNKEIEFMKGFTSKDAIITKIKEYFNN